MGYTFNFHDNKYIIRHKKRNMPPIFFPMVGRRMFPINTFYLFEFTLMPKKIDESLIWNKSYGHLHFNAMNLLYTNNMFLELSSISFEDQVF